MAKMDEKYGFREVTFEQPVSSFKNLKFFVKKGLSKIYDRSNESLLLGTYRLQHVYYTFYKGLLSEVTVTLSERPNVEGVFGLLVKAYGPAAVVENTYQWEGQRVRMTLQPSYYGSEAILRVFSKPLLQREQADKEASDRRAASEL
ncbi:hypothetical protein [Hymenobacter sp. BT491]|uniref:hypothetical protein n=1 Tax=Hymenobacter sp. BT491 TaxID=2766779 RepID=UPI001653A21F|nr:hypothetical protein [Hymenobacter sp. BT491]MBC6989913.1 hypothetical protein [Hymenobacter sp. BT491]